MSSVKVTVKLVRRVSGERSLRSPVTVRPARPFKSRTAFRATVYALPAQRWGRYSASAVTVLATGACAPQTARRRRTGLGPGCTPSNKAARVARESRTALAPRPLCPKTPQRVQIHVRLPPSVGCLQSRFHAGACPASGYSCCASVVLTKMKTV